jgi:DASH complex subunit ASK1
MSSVLLAQTGPDVHFAFIASLILDIDSSTVETGRDIRWTGMSQNHQDNPLLHPPFYVIPGISPNAPVSAQVQQIDQRNTLLLQEIDANFAKFHQVITSKILPEIKRFAIGSEPVREASQVSSHVLSPVTELMRDSSGGRSSRLLRQIGST